MTVKFIPIHLAVRGSPYRNFALVIFNAIIHQGICRNTIVIVQKEKCSCNQNKQNR
jgi:hypothetical protein